MLIALVEHASGVSRRIFDRHRVTVDAVREEIQRLLGTELVATPADVPRASSDRSPLAIAHAVHTGHRRTPGRHYNSDDLLSALVADDVAQRSVASAVMMRFGMTPAAVRDELAEL